MGGTHEIAFGFSPEQQSLLDSQHHSLKPLKMVGRLDMYGVLMTSIQPAAAYLFSLVVLTSSALRFEHSSLAFTILGIGLTLLLAVPVISFVVLLLGVLSALCFSSVRKQAVVFWMFWPTARCALSVCAALAGIHIADTLWNNDFWPVLQTNRMQTYTSVNPSRVQGSRMLDAGIVLFVPNATVDREIVGCLKHEHTYCIAPVVMPNAAATSNQDVFVTGVDCCGECPGLFSCGDWDSPYSVGGLRVLDKEQHHWFYLVLGDWMQSYNQGVSDPIFLQWIADPVEYLVELQQTGVRHMMAAAFFGPIAVFVIVGLLNGICVILLDFKIAVPLEAPLPPPGIARSLGQRLMPQIFKYQASLQANRGPDFGATS